MSYKMGDSSKRRGGKREGAGRPSGEETVTTSFRVHKESIEVIRKAKYPINAEVNKLVKKVAKRLKKVLHNQKD